MTSKATLCQRQRREPFGMRSHRCNRPKLKLRGPRSFRLGRTRGLTARQGRRCLPARSERRRRTPQARALERTRDCKSCAFPNLLSASELTTQKLRRLVIRSLEETPRLQVGKCPLSHVGGFPDAPAWLRRATGSALRKARALHETAGSAHADPKREAPRARGLSVVGLPAGLRNAPTRVGRPRGPLRGRPN